MLEFLHISRAFQLIWLQTSDHGSGAGLIGLIAADKQQLVVTNK